MLNISNNELDGRLRNSGLRSLDIVESKITKRVFRRMLTIFSIMFLLILFLPWTQTIRSNGYLTALKPEQRPQTITTIIGGKIDRWYVQEGDQVKKGDTLLKITEVKTEYFDDQLVARTKSLIDLKERAIETYGDKLVNQSEQLRLTEDQRRMKREQNKIKLQQTQLKVQNDSLSYIAARANYQTAKYQYQRMDSLYQKGLKSLTDLESRNLKMQETAAYELEAKNKWLNSKSELVALQLEISNTDAYYNSVATKIQSDQLTTVNDRLDSENSLTKLKNQYTNYVVRNGLYYILAPSDGYVTKTYYYGAGEIIKEGQKVLSFMPNDLQLAVETYVDPIDLPLVHVGEHVRLQFDGWPAIVFSGWPNVSHGTYGGTVYAIDKFISENGKYRILVAPDKNDYPWPTALRVGSGSKTLLLLNDVPIWYEAWRQINGFPPNFYQPQKPVKK